MDVFHYRENTWRALGPLLCTVEKTRRLHDFFLVFVAISVSVVTGILCQVT